jgi:translation initiation factor IF-3
MNDRIRGREVRLIDEEGQQVGVVSREEAMRRAEEADLDLVLMSPGDPPVCRLMDYSKQRYLDQKRKKEARQKSSRQETKVVQFRPKIAEHDYDFKKRNTIKFLKAGDRVQAQIFFRGREQQHPELGMRILERLIEEVKEFGRPVAAQKPKHEGRTITLILEPGVAKKEKEPTPTAAPTSPTAPAADSAPAAPAVVPSAASATPPAL